MAEGDKAALELKKVGNGTAQDIIEGLKPFISGEMTALKNSLGSAVGMLESLKLVCCQLPDVKKGVDALVEEEACLQFASQSILKALHDTVGLKSRVFRSKPRLLPPALVQELVLQRQLSFKVTLLSKPGLDEC